MNIVPFFKSPIDAIKNVSLNSSQLLALLLLAIFIVASICIDPELASALHLDNRFVPPIWDVGGQWQHLLGTDHLGRDVLVRLLAGAKTSLIVGVFSAMLATTGGVFFGVLLGYLGGGAALMGRFILAVHLAMPALIIMLLMVWFFGDSLLWVVCIIAFIHLPWFLSISQKLTPELMAQDFISAAVCGRLSIFQIFIREVLPNLLPVIVSLFALEVTAAILTEATLSYLGVGVRGEAASWGGMIADAQSVIIFRPWLTILPALCLFLLSISILCCVRPQRVWKASAL